MTRSDKRKNKSIRRQSKRKSKRRSKKRSKRRSKRRSRKRTINYRAASSPTLSSRRRRSGVTPISTHDPMSIGLGNLTFVSHHVQHIVDSQDGRKLITERGLRTFYGPETPCHDEFIDRLNDILLEIYFRLTQNPKLEELITYLPEGYSCTPDERLLYSAKLFEPIPPVEKKYLSNHLLNKDALHSLFKNIILMNLRGVYHNDLAQLKNIVISSDGNEWGVIDWEFANIDMYRGNIQTRRYGDLETITYTSFFFSEDIYIPARPGMRLWDVFQLLSSLHRRYKRTPGAIDYIGTQINNFRYDLEKDIYGRKVLELFQL